MKGARDVEWGKGKGDGADLSGVLDDLLDIAFGILLVWTVCSLSS